MITVRQSMSSRGSRADIHMILFIRTAGMITGSIFRTNIAPLLIGEWGGYMTEPNVTWMTYLRQLISENKINHTFWCFNANSGDTGGLVKDDFTTWDTEKYNFVKEVLWQKDGKFVGLDHEIPLGENGITLTEY